MLITGAARGLGAETARRVAARGANVALVGLEPEELERVAAQCGANAAWFECDVTDVDALERAVAGTVERFGGIDVVMANAGIAPMGMVRSIDPPAFERTIEINLLGVWRTVRTCLPHVIERAGLRARDRVDWRRRSTLPGMAAYAASKAGAEAFADSLAVRGEAPRASTSASATSASSTRTWSAGPTRIRRSGRFARTASGPLSKTYPLSKAGKALADGIEKRQPLGGRAAVRACADRPAHRCSSRWSSARPKRPPRRPTSCSFRTWASAARPPRRHRSGRAARPPCACRPRPRAAARPTASKKAPPSPSPSREPAAG